MPKIDANRFQVETDGDLQVCATVNLRLCYQTGEAGMVEGGSLWIFYDIRQYLERDQTFLPEGGVTVSGPAGVTWEGVPLVGGKVVRTFDIHPQAPEFLHAVHIICTGGKIGPDETVTVWLKTDREGFRLPQNAIDAFRFWLVEDPRGELTFHHPGGKYHFFLPRTLDPSLLVSNPLSIAPGPPTDLRVTCPSISTGHVEPNLTLLDAYGNPLPHPDGPVHFRTRAGQTSGRPVRLEAPHDAVTVTCNGLETRSNSVRILDSTPKHTLYWGDIHGMQFNQRPLRDYFAWAKEIAHLDFSGGQLFSYSACIEEVWHQLLDAWHEFTQPGDFISLPSIEFGTPPDGSHRLGFFPDTENLTPVFCEDRPEAHDPRLHARFHPETIYCKDYRKLYDAVHARGGFTQGHFHTAFYEQERVAEIYQKQHVNPDFEEAKINRAIQFQGLKLAIVSGSDTHDSRPANPYPEPGPENPAGLTGVWAERLDRPALFDAFFQRRCYATTGARIVIDFRVNNRPMGDTVQADSFTWTAEILGTAEIDRIELMVNGVPTQTFTPGEQFVTLDGVMNLPFSVLNIQYCYLRLWQKDGQRAWTSPVWMERSRDHEGP